MGESIELAPAADMHVPAQCFNGSCLGAFETGRPNETSRTDHSAWWSIRRPGHGTSFPKLAEAQAQFDSSCDYNGDGLSI